MTCATIWELYIASLKLNNLNKEDISNAFFIAIILPMQGPNRIKFKCIRVSEINSEIPVVIQFIFKNDVVMT